MVVGCIPEWENRILLCRRAIEPRKGKWTLPAGFMENNETLAQGAARETLEEANARVEILDLYAAYSLPHISQVYLLFRAKLLDLDFSPGIESLEVSLFEERDIPWDEIAFQVIRIPLERFLAERRTSQPVFHTGQIDHNPI
jgi:ADP-ribose pyrophosphatase YjhB (NUDIX family)